jgi:hypothetical protein
MLQIPHFEWTSTLFLPSIMPARLARFLVTFNSFFVVFCLLVVDDGAVCGAGSWWW